MNHEDNTDPLEPESLEVRVARIEAVLEHLRRRDERREVEYQNERESLLSFSDTICRVVDDRLIANETEAAVWRAAHDERIAEVRTHANDLTAERAQLLVLTAREIFPHMRALINGRDGHVNAAFSEMAQTATKVLDAFDLLNARLDDFEGRLTGWQTSVQFHLENIAARIKRLEAPPAA